ncbi:MAG: MarR family winged helix-turn-helix transcriptional regulator, partial [Propionivibrio sp.]
MSAQSIHPSPLTLEVLQQFRIIYGALRQHFREVEERCGLTGSQMWILQEIARTPGLGVTGLAGRMGIHQSTCSQLVEKLVALGCLTKSRQAEDQRRVGLWLAAGGDAAISVLPGPAQGILPAALASLPDVAIKTLHINLSELIRHLPGKDDSFARTPLAEFTHDAEFTTGQYHE